MIGFWAAFPHVKGLRKFDDLMRLEIDDIREGRKRNVTKTIVRAQTPEEKAILDSIRNSIGNGE